ncbi:GrpB family protein [Idiomarina sp.]|uniref:GrpB family protein n=1 Tax=Idiomarina sp. TaxID=1874361 RepID=UPI003A908B84
MKIVKYEKVPADFKPWTSTYLLVARELIQLIQTEDIDVMHFGSTSAKVGGKGIIDLSVLYEKGQIDLAIDRLKSLGFQEQIAAKPFPPERPRKDGAVIYEGEKYLVHAHVIEKGSEEHVRQKDYRDYLLSNPSAREEYELSKKSILEQGIKEQDAYGKLKSPFVKSVLNKLKA